MRDQTILTYSKIREIESYAIREHRERICNYGTESAGNIDLLWNILYPTSRDKLDKLFLNFTIKQISLLSIPKLEGMGFTNNEAIKVQSVFELARSLEIFVEEPKRKISVQRTFMF